MIAGAGGQGIMVLGKVLAEAAMREDKHVLWLPAYGPEVRGGTAHCTVIISDEPIASPYIKQADTLIIMNEPSLKKFLPRVKEKGLLVINSSLVKEEIKATFQVESHPFTDKAIALGNSKTANMVALGCFIAKKNLVTSSSALKAIAYLAPPDKPQLIAINTQALHAGMALVTGGSQS